jgi:hypothetical protein
MSRVLITCPETGKNIYTGLNMEWNQLDAVEIGEHELDCPECGQRHSWTRHDAILQADGGA